MSTELIINASLPETRIALMESGEIQDLLIERAQGKGIVGNIYKGRVTRVLPGMQAAFVDIGLEKAAFLYVDDVYVHSEIWEEEEGGQQRENPLQEIQPVPQQASADTPTENVAAPAGQSQEPALPAKGPEEFDLEEGDLSDDGDDDEEDDEDDGDEEDDDDDDIEEMGPPPEGEDGNGGDESAGNRAEPQGTVAPPSSEGAAPDAQGRPPGRRHRRGRRGGRFRKRGPGQNPEVKDEAYPENYREQVQDHGEVVSDRSSVGEEVSAGGEGERPQIIAAGSRQDVAAVPAPNARQEFRSQRGRDRRIRSRNSMRPPRPQVSIQDLLKEGQEVLVQVAKDPIATKGARLTCHISLPGRNLVCMPTIDHVGVSRRIERDDERRRLREHVERNRPRGLGFIVRTASGKQSEQTVKQDIEYLSRIWSEIREKAAEVTAPAMVYEDLNSVLRAIRDWVTEEIDKIIVDSRYHYNDIQRFVSHFMPSLKSKVELYHGDIPIFDAYGISAELSRALERKVWLKSGGYLVIDQAEALVAIDVNTGRFVGKKNLEDTILKTNLEAVQEIAYQLRLRNCGGIIILDLIDMEKEENKHRVYRALEEAIKKDRARPSIIKISELGLVEMTRKRTRDTMVRTLCESCSHCEGKGFIKNKSTVAYEILREIERDGVDRDISKILVQSHPDVIDILAIDERETLDQLERRYHKQIYLQAVADMHAEQFEVTTDKVERGGKGYDPREREREQRQSRGRHQRGGRDKERGRGGHSRPIPRSASGEPGATSPSVIINPVITPVVSDGEIQPPQIEGNENTGGVSPETAAPATPGGDDFYDEEDRLAFLRAQAAQDAALARLRSSGEAAPTRPGVGSGGGARDRGDKDRGGRGRRGRRGGRFRKDQRPRTFSPRDGQPAGPAPKPLSQQSAPPADPPAPQQQGDGGSSGGGDGTGHSQPPV